MRINWNADIKREVHETKEQLRKEKRKDLTEVERKLSVVKEDIKNLRMEMTGNGERKPVPKEYFKTWDSYKVRFSNGINMNEEMLDYIAQEGIRTIMSELPEEARTPEITKNIVERMKEQIEKSSIKI